MRIPSWPNLVFIFVPLSIAMVDGAILVRERNQPTTEKVLRLVKESNSRKENFTVQQCLYTTVYHRKDVGESIQIDGWRAAQDSPGGSVVVEFSYEDSIGKHVALWEADLKTRRVSPKNDAALDLSWH